MWARGARLQPGNAEARLQLGDVHLRLGDLEAAEAALREAVRMDPEDNWLRQYWEFVRRRAAGGG